jgi:hypothetical protein
MRITRSRRSDNPNCGKQSRASKQHSSEQGAAEQAPRESINAEIRLLDLNEGEPCMNCAQHREEENHHRSSFVRVAKISTCA